MNSFNCLLIGDGGVGKTALASVFTQNIYPGMFHFSKLYENQIIPILKYTHQILSPNKNRSNFLSFIY